jgi:hypothetical protein
MSSSFPFSLSEFKHSVRDTFFKGKVKSANQLIDRTTATRNPFDAKYSKVEDADWETCATVLDPMSVKDLLNKGW